MYEQKKVRFHMVEAPSQISSPCVIRFIAEMGTDHNDWVHGISFSPDRRTFVTVSGGGDMYANIYAYDLEGLYGIKKESGIRGEDQAQKQDNGDRSQPLWQVLVEKIKHKSGVMGVAHSPCGKFFATTCMDRSVNFFRCRTYVDGGKTMPINPAELAKLAELGTMPSNLSRAFYSLDTKHAATVRCTT
jgi:WD40 repeat protein